MRDILIDLVPIDNCCFIIIDNKLNVITLETLETLYIDIIIKIIYNPLKHYYYNGLKFVVDEIKFLIKY